MPGSTEANDAYRLVRAQATSEFEGCPSCSLEASDPTSRATLRLRLRIGRAEERHRLAWRVIDGLPWGVILLGADCVIRESNSAARVMLQSADGLERSRDGTLCASGMAPTRRLAKLVAQAATGRGRPLAGALAVPRPSGRRPLQLLVVSVGLDPTHAGAGRSVVVYVSDPECELRLCTERLRQTFDLTSTEARIASDLACGTSTREVAARGGVGPSTVRWHLKQIYAKTGTRRQTELVRLILTSPLRLFS